MDSMISPPSTPERLRHRPASFGAGDSSDEGSDEGLDTELAGISLGLSSPRGSTQRIIISPSPADGISPVPLDERILPQRPVPAMGSAHASPLHTPQHSPHVSPSLRPRQTPRAAPELDPLGTLEPQLDDADGRLLISPTPEAGLPAVSLSIQPQWSPQRARRRQDGGGGSPARVVRMQQRSLNLRSDESSGTFMQMLTPEQASRPTVGGGGTIFRAVAADSAPGLRMSPTSLQPDGDEDMPSIFLQPEPHWSPPASPQRPQPSTQRRGSVPAEGPSPPKLPKASQIPMPIELIADNGLLVAGGRGSPTTPVLRDQFEGPGKNRVPEMAGYGGVATKLDISPIRNPRRGGGSGRSLREAARKEEPAMWFAVDGVLPADVPEATEAEQMPMQFSVTGATRRKKRTEATSIGRQASVNKQQLSIFKHEGQFFAMREECAHQGGPLHLGDIEDVGGKVCVVCPWHGWSYDAEDGACTQGDTSWVQPRYEVREEGGRLFVGFDEMDNSLFASEDF